LRPPRHLAFLSSYILYSPRLELPLITADTTLAKKLANTGLNVISLESLPA
jgi:hypothetical protein